MITDITAGADQSGGACARVRRRVHWMFWLPTLAICLPLIFLLITFGWEISLLAAWLMSGDVVPGHPDYANVQGQLNGRLIGVGVLVVLLGGYLLVWIRWYRKALSRASVIRTLGTAN
ncbi:hypothetical protein J7E83_02265 [Arthrobacter sp. ISL-48]|uniref:hypothetical protein n=1 Tax=Arthrobacter sp. ISL-48 TaxID=2819110 RepID=UPI001BEC2975|nr:hypothetical protein [Arthrobacter sp. ISL-48]MBT2530964.1 hypothetical protein [Arthrobacter sp. ISL-48]